MSDAVCFNFFSDSNQTLAIGELELLSLADMQEDSFSVYIGKSEYASLQDSIDAIMETYGAQKEF